MRSDEPDVLDMLIRHELVIKRLYEIFAERFTTHQDLWQRLARDEQRHADRLQTLKPDSTIKKWLLYDNRLKIPVIRSSIGYIERQIVRAQKGDLRLLQSLSIAKDIESALLEKQFSKLSVSPSKEIQLILVTLTAETERHREMLVEAIDTEKRQSS